MLAVETLAATTIALIDKTCTFIQDRLRARRLSIASSHVDLGGLTTPDHHESSLLSSSTTPLDHTLSSGKPRTRSLPSPAELPRSQTSGSANMGTNGSAEHGLRACDHYGRIRHDPPWRGDRCLIAEVPTHSCRHLQGELDHTGKDLSQDFGDNSNSRSSSKFPSYSPSTLSDCANDSKVLILTRKSTWELSAGTIVT